MPRTDFKDNQPTLDLLELKGTGLFPMLDEEVPTRLGRRTRRDFFFFSWRAACWLAGLLAAEQEPILVTPGLVPPTSSSPWLPSWSPLLQVNVPRASDETYLSKIQQAHAKHPNFVRTPASKLKVGRLP